MVHSLVNINQIRRAIRRLPLSKRTRLLDELQKETTREGLRQTVDRIRTHVRKNPIAQKEIDAAVKAAQKEYYARRGR